MQMTFDINPGHNMHCRREFIYVAHICICITDELSKAFAFVAHFFTEGARGGGQANCPYYQTSTVVAGGTKSANNIHF